MILQRFLSPSRLDIFLHKLQASSPWLRSFCTRSSKIASPSCLCFLARFWRTPSVTTKNGPIMIFDGSSARTFLARAYCNKFEFVKSDHKSVRNKRGPEFLPGIFQAHFKVRHPTWLVTFEVTPLRARGPLWWSSRGTEMFQGDLNA